MTLVFVLHFIHIRSYVLIFDPIYFTQYTVLSLIEINHILWVSTKRLRNIGSFYTIYFLE